MEDRVKELEYSQKIILKLFCDLSDDYRATIGRDNQGRDDRDEDTSEFDIVNSGELDPKSSMCCSKQVHDSRTEGFQ